jgi:hypothetical protein
MKRRTLRAFNGVTAGILAAALFGVPVQPATATASGEVDDANATGPRVLTGTVVDENGAPLGGARIYVYALGNTESGDTQSMDRIALARSDAHGDFVVAGALRRIVRLNPDGSVPLELDVVTRDETKKIFNLDAVAPQGPNGQWTWGAQVDHELVSDDADTADSEAHKPITDIVLDMKEAHVAPGGPPGKSNGSQNGDMTAAMTYSDCKNQPYYLIKWFFTGTTTDRLTPIQKIDTATHGKVKYAYSNTSNTKFQIAYGGTGPNYAGGFAYSIEDSYGAGVDATVGNNFNGAWTLNYRYRQYEQFCTTHDWVDTYSEAQQYGASSGETKWQAHHWLGGSQPVSNYDLYYCYSGVPAQNVYGTLWVARSTTSTLQGYFNVAGVGLDTTQQNSDYHKLSWSPDSTSNYVRICGNNSDPLHANKVREVNY